jgi:hypothetical protein
MDYKDGIGWAESCTGKHAEDSYLRADLNDFVGLITKRPQRP